MTRVAGTDIIFRIGVAHWGGLQIIGVAQINVRMSIVKVFSSTQNRKRYFILAIVPVIWIFWTNMSKIQKLFRLSKNEKVLFRILNEI